MENLANDTVGSVVLQSDLGTQTDYPFTTPAGMTITYIKSDAQFDLADIALDEIDFIKDGFLWFAGEKTMVKRVREAVKQRQDETEQGFQNYIAAYWSVK